MARVKDEIEGNTKNEERIESEEQEEVRIKQVEVNEI